MTSHRRKTSVYFALVLGLMMAIPPAAFAQRANDEEEEEGAAPTIDANTGEILNEAIEFLNMDNYDAARAAIAELRLDRLSPYERSRVEQILFNIEYTEGNYDTARDHLLAAIAAGGLNETETSALRFQIAQLYMQEENWAEGAAALEEWFETAQNPNSAAYYLLAVAYYQQDDTERALEPARQAVELTERPESSWLELLLALYLQREEYMPAIPLLERLVTMEPENKSYWLRLSSIYQQIEDFPNALATMQLAYGAGLLTEESELVRLIDMLRFNEVPYQGAKVLEKALEDETVTADAEIYNKLADCWIQAREFDEAIPPLERAAELSDTGDLYVRLGQVHVQREDWAAASTALGNALDKGDLEDTADAQVMMGIALFNQEMPQEARDWFERARDSDEHGEMARDYITLIDSQAAAR